MTGIAAALNRKRTGRIKTTASDLLSAPRASR
jgi:hypothetical protein